MLPSYSVSGTWIGNYNDNEYFPCPLLNTNESVSSAMVAGGTPNAEAPGLSAVWCLFSHFFNFSIVRVERYKFNC